MTPNKFNQLVKECIQEILSEGRLICAWCNKDIGEFAGEGDSHGMCPVCYEKQMAELDLINPTNQYSLPLPPEARIDKPNIFSKS
jgi:hypothetical protein